MSLFSNLGQSKPQQGPSLFSSTQTPASSTQGGASLFGSAPAASQSSGQTSGNLFGGTPSQPQQPQNASGSSLFGNLGSSQASKPQASSGGLFGGMGSSQSRVARPGAGPDPFGGGPSNAKPPAQASSGLGMFGGGSTSQSQPNQAATAGGLFGGTQSSSQPLQSQAPSGTSLFGNPLGQSQAQTQQSGQNLSSLFGPSGQTTSQAPAQSTFNTFSGTGGTADQAPQNQSQQSNGAGAPSAYFDHLLERGKKRNKREDGDSQFGDLPALQLGLGDIARKVRYLGTGGPSAQEARGGDTRAHYLLAASGVSPASAVRDLRSFTNQTATTSDTNALDTDVEGYLSNLQAQSTLALIAEGLEQSKRDFDTFLEENVQMEWDAQRRRIYEHFGLAKQNDLSDNGPRGGSGASPAAQSSFGRSTRKSRLGASASSAAGVSFGASGLAKSVIGTGSVRHSGRPAGFADVADKASLTNHTQGVVHDRYQRDKQERLAEKIKQLNLARLEETVYPLLHNLIEVEKDAGVDSLPQVVDAFRALVEITGEDPSAERASDPRAVAERKYAGEYLDENPNSDKSISIRKRILNGSRRFLEKQFLNQLEAAIAKNPREANLGGVPTTINKVRAYIRLRAARKELGPDNVELQTLGDDHCWVLIFYLLRAGLVDEAARYVRENERAVRSMDRNFPQYMTHFAARDDRRLPPELQARISAEYQQRSRIAPENSVDPYRMACFKVIGRCEVSRRGLENINQNMEDWVWLQFALAREVHRVEEAAGDVFGLDDLKMTVTDIGQKHFSQSGSEGGAGVGVFFFLQILAGMFEQAVAYLYPHDYVAAVHFAIALDYYGLLRVSDPNAPGSDLLSFTTRQEPQINFGPMVGYYTRDFRAAKAEAATDYLTLICLNADPSSPTGQSHAALCHEALRELVLETREFAQLLGDIRSDGQRIKGAIEHRLHLIRLANEEEFLRTVTKQAASIADDCGRITDAVLLYHLAEEYDTVISILNRTLSDAVAVDLGQEHVRLEPLKPRAEEAQGGGQRQSSLSLTSVDDPIELGRNMMQLYDSRSMYYEKIRPANRAACLTLLQMREIKSLTEEGKWAMALDVVTAINLVPVKAHSNVAEIRAMAQNLGTLPTEIGRNIGNLLVWTITCVGKQREVFRSTTFDDPTRKAMADTLLTMAKDLMVFAGLVRYKLSPHVFEMLAQAGQNVGT